MKYLKLVVVLLACAAEYASAAETPAAKPKAVEASKAEAPKPAAEKTPDRLTLESTTVTGNRELPKVLYIVPWKKADIGNLPGQPFNTLLDEALTPVDREVFRREVDYYEAIASKAESAKTGDAK